MNFFLQISLFDNTKVLLAHLSVDLTGFDFSHFPIWQAYLADVKLQHVNFAYADLAKTVFAETFGGVSSVAFSPNGSLLATSDTGGEVQIWEIASGRQLNAFKEKLNQPDIQHLTIAGIAAECGFSSQATFQRIFKETEGVSPSVYVKQIQKTV